METNKAYTKAFTVFKQGVTESPINIVYLNGQFFDYNFKIQKYLSLGYTVSNINAEHK